MKLETKRLFLRKLLITDAKSLAKNGNEKSMPYFTWYVPYPFTPARAKKTIRWLNSGSRKKENDTIVFAIISKSEREAIGIVDVYDIDTKDKKAKIGFWIGKNYRGQGLSSEAVKEIIKFSFENLGLQKISADVLIDNIASNNLLEKLGFRKVGVMKNEKIIEKKALDCFLWEILKSR